MGFKDVLPLFHLNSFFGTDKDNYIMSEVKCKGNEIFFGMCPHKTLNFCKRNEAVGISCIDPKTIELKDGENKYEGKVYLAGLPLVATQPDIGITSSIWSKDEAKVVCTQIFGEEFGRKEEDGVPVFSHEFEENTLETVETCLEVKCNGNEKVLTKCDVSVSRKCDNIRLASVKCAKCTPGDLVAILNGLSMEGTNTEIVYSINKVLLKLKEECRDWVDCHELNPQYREYCLVKSFLQDTLSHLTPSSKGKKIILKTSIDHLEMLKNNFLNQKFSEIQLQIGNLGEAITSNLGNYFGNLAKYDESLSKADLEYTRGSWKNSNSILESLQKELTMQLIDIFALAFSVTEADIAQQISTMAVAAVSMGNPLSAIVNGADSFLEFESRLNEVAKTGHRMFKLIFTPLHLLPRLRTCSLSIAEKIRKNAKLYGEVKDLLFNENSKVFTEENLKEFLQSYQDFDPALVKHELHEYMEILEQIVQVCCETIENPETAFGVVPAIAAAAIGSCPKAKVNVKRLSGLYDDMSEKQIEIMDSFGKVARAKIAQSGARSIEQSFKKSFSEQIEKDILVLNAMYLLRYHKSILIENACNYLTYMNYGKQPIECDTLLINPNGDVTPLISTKQCHMCECPGVVKETDIFRIPAQLSVDNNFTGAIDLSRLYGVNNAKETDGVTLFKIPGRQWLIDNQWIDLDQKGPFFLEELNLYLPPTSPYNYKLSLVALESEVNGKAYVIDDEIVIINKYTENSNRNCREIENNPYNVEACKSQLGNICITTSGKIKGHLLPSLENSIWKITLKSAPLNMPQPENKFYLFARASICYKGKSKKKAAKKSETLLNHEVCCQNQKMFYNHFTKQCAKCATGSEPRLFGHYCEKCPRGHEQKCPRRLKKNSPRGHKEKCLGVFGCKACAPGYFKAEDGSGECKKCPPNTIAPLEGSFSCIPRMTVKKAEDEM